MHSFSSTDESSEVTYVQRAAYFNYSIYLIAHETQEIYPRNKLMRRKRKWLKGKRFWFKRSPCAWFMVWAGQCEGHPLRGQQHGHKVSPDCGSLVGIVHTDAATCLQVSFSMVLTVFPARTGVFGKHKVWEYNIDESLIILISTLMNIPCSAWAGRNISLCFLKD